MVKGLVVPDAEPDQPVNTYPLAGVAVTATVEPSAYEPPEGLTLPPVEGELLAVNV